MLFAGKVIPKGEWAGRLPILSEDKFAAIVCGEFDHRMAFRNEEAGMTLELIESEGQLNLIVYEYES